MANQKPLLNLSVIFTVLWSLSGPVFAQGLNTLQITPTANQDETVGFTLNTLDELDQVEFETTTIWTDGTIKFSGVALKDLLNHVGADGNMIEMVALNDYSVSMPISEIEDGAPIVATRMNGQPMSVRDKGPFWIVFPYDKSPKYQTENVYSLSIWQLNKLNLLE